MEPSDKLAIAGNVAKAQELEAYNVQLEKVFQADHCHNCDRIMRLPGTINVPTEKKAKKGRKPALTRLIDYNGNTYTPTASRSSPRRCASRPWATACRAEGQR